MRSDEVELKSAKLARLLTRQEAAEYCSVSPTTFDSICPIIPFALVKGRPRLNRFDKHDIDQWIKQLKGLNDNLTRSTNSIIDRLDP